MTLTKNKVALTLFALVFVFTCLLQETLIQNVDSSRRYQVTKAITSNAPPVWPEDFYDNHYLRGTDGGQYYWYGLGQTIFMVPADFAAWQTLNLFSFENPDTKESLRRTIVSTLTFPAIAGATVAVAFLFLMELEFSLLISLLGALFFFFGTTELHYSMIHQENSQLTFLVFTGYYMMTRWVKQNRLIYLLIGGGLFGTLLLVRLTTSADIFAVTLFTALLLFWNNKKLDLRGVVIRRFIKFAAIFGGEVAFYFLLDRLYQFKRFGSFTSTYVSVQSDQMYAGTFNYQGTFGPNFPYDISPVEGVLNVLFSPEKSIFIYDPLLVVLVIVLVVRSFRLDLSSTSNIRKAFLASGIFSLVLYLIGYSNIEYWGGDTSWAARYHTMPVQQLCLLTVPLFLEATPALNVWVKRIIQGLIGLAVFVQICSIVFWYNLEISQFDCGAATNFRIIQRVINIVTVLTGTYHVPANCSSFPDNTYLFFWPVYAAVDYIPKPLLPAITIIWLVAVVVISWAIIRYIRRSLKLLRREQLKTPPISLSEPLAESPV